MHRITKGMHKTGLSGKNTHKVSAGEHHHTVGKAIKDTETSGRKGLSKVNKIGGPKKTDSLVHNKRHGGKF